MPSWIWVTTESYRRKKCEVHPGTIGRKMQSSATPAVPVEFDDVEQRHDGAQPGEFMFIGELASETGTDPKTIRYYEREGLLSPPRHGRFRTYMASDVRRLKDVLIMRRLGIGIANIRKVLETATDGLDAQHMEKLLASHLELLRSRQTEVAKQLEETSDILQRYRKDIKDPNPKAVVSTTIGLHEKVASLQSNLALDIV